MAEFHVTLYGDDAARAEDLKERMDRELPGSTSSNAEAVRTLLDLAEEELNRGRR